MNIQLSQNDFGLMRVLYCLNCGKARAAKAANGFVTEVIIIKDIWAVKVYEQVVESAWLLASMLMQTLEVLADFDRQLAQGERFSWRWKIKHV